MTDSASQYANATVNPQHPPALIRSVAPVIGPIQSLPRPKSLIIVGQPQSSLIVPDLPDGGEEIGGEEERFPSSEDERTPEEGRQEFVGHDYYKSSARWPSSGAMMISPELRHPPIPMIGGLVLSTRCYRRQYSDRNCACSDLELEHSHQV